MMTTTVQASEGVYYLSLSVENVRCFAQKQTLNLSDDKGRPAQWTVILGDNGVGKTTLLEVLAAGVDDNYYFQSDNSCRRIDTTQSKILAVLACNSLLDNKSNDFSKIVYLINVFAGHVHRKIIRDESDDLCLLSIIKKRRDDEKSIFPIINRMLTSPAYGASRHQKTISPFLSGNTVMSVATNGYLNDLEELPSEQLEQTDNIPNKPLGNYQSPLEGELINAEEWLLQTDYIANKVSDIQATYKERLNTIKSVLISLLPNVEDIRISIPSPQSPNPKVEFKTPDGWLSLTQLSLGYQSMTAWMVDLAARLFDKYPDSPNPIAEPAVVLIDEIDLHLHPKWQRTIMAYLSERFINTQFIVTAHSPLIVQAAEQANIVVLKRGEQGVTIHQHPKDIQGWRVDQLLTSDLFDLGSARSPHYEALLAERQKILAKPHLSAEDQARLKALAAEIGDLPTAETAEDIDAMAIIRRAAQLLKTKS